MNNKMRITQKYLNKFFHIIFKSTKKISKEACSPMMVLSDHPFHSPQSTSPCSKFFLHQDAHQEISLISGISGIFSFKGMMSR